MKKFTRIFCQCGQELDYSHSGNKYTAIKCSQCNPSELLEALRKIANISRYPISDPENIAFALETAREIARTVIAKAEGKEEK